MNRAAGFSLVELLVVLALTGLIGVMVAGGVRFGLAAWDRGGALVDQVTETRAVQRLLRRQLAQIAPVRLRDGTREPPVLFQGRADRLRAVAPLPAALAPGGAQIIGYDVERRDGGLALVLRWVPLGAAPPSLEFGPEVPGEVLLSGLQSLAFRYDGAAEWPAGPRLPRLIEVEAAWPGGARVWPPLAIAVAP